MTSGYREVKINSPIANRQKAPPLLGWMDVNVRLFEAWPVRILCGYFLFHLILRSLLPVPIGFDEGEQFLVTQEWAWGYSSQPPLYNWLQRMAFLFCGFQDGALVAVKQSVLLAIFLTTYSLWRKVGLNVALASACTFSLLLMNEVGWELQRTRTHLSLAVLMGAIFTWLSISIFKDEWKGRESIGYGLLGCVSGLGMLAKYNFCLLPVGLLTAAFCFSRTRRYVFNGWVLWTLAIAVSVFAPHFFWYLENADSIKQSFANKFGIEPSVGSALLAGATNFGSKTFVFFLQPLIIFSIFALDWRDWTYRKSNSFDDLSSDAKSFVRFIALGSLVGIAITALIVVGAGITQFKSRWLVPTSFLLIGPLILWSWFLLGPNVRRAYWLAVLLLLTISSIAIVKEASEGYSQEGDFENLPGFVFETQEWDSVQNHPEKSLVIIDDPRIAAMLRKENALVRVAAPGYKMPSNFEATDVYVLTEIEEGCVDQEIQRFIKDRFLSVDRDLNLIDPELAHSQWLFQLVDSLE